MKMNRIAKVIVCDAHRTAKIAHFRGCKRLPTTPRVDHFAREMAGLMHFSRFESAAVFYALKWCDSYRGLQKHIASQTCITRFGELSIEGVGHLVVGGHDTKQCG